MKNISTVQGGAYTPDYDKVRITNTGQDGWRREEMKFKQNA
jgi:hypothetical protein